MLKPSRAFLAIGFVVFLVGAIPVSTNLQIKTSVYSFFKIPFQASGETSSFLQDLFSFRKNAEENRRLKKKLAKSDFDRFRVEEAVKENERLTSLLLLKKSLPAQIKKVIYARVLINAPLAWNKMLLLDKGSKEGIKLNKLVLSDYALIGKIVEIGPTMSKVRLITDPNSKIGVMIQRSRQQGILFGTASGQCKMKYLSLDADVKEGDVVETAGFNSFFPKGLRVGTVLKVWKEPGEIYQVALIQPAVNMTRLEEIGVVE